MKKGKTKEGLISMKKIENSLKNFEKRMTESSNDLDRLIILDDLDGILEAEIDEWLKIKDSLDGNDPEGDENVYNECIIQIADLTDSRLKLNELRAEFVVNAQKLKEVYDREGKNYKMPKSLINVI